MSSASSSGRRPHPLMRIRDGREARVSDVELLFDLIYVFAIIQVSHFLLDHLTPLGALRRLWRTVDVYPVASRRLAGVHRLIGVSEEAFETLAMFGVGGHPDTDR